MEMEIKPSATVMNTSKPAPETKPAPAQAASAAPVAGSGAPSKDSQVNGGTSSAAPGAETDKPGRRAAAAAKRERQAAAKVTEAEQKAAEAKTVTEQAAKYEAAIKSGDPDKILAAFDLDDEKLVDMYIAKHGSKEPGEGASKAEKDAAIEELKAELAKFKQELADEKVKAEEKRKAEETTAAVRQHLDAIKGLATKPEHAERFELVNAEGPAAYDLAFDVMVEIHKLHKKFISYEEALDLTENHLLAQEKARIERNAKLKKLGGSVPAKTEAKTDEKPAGAPSSGIDSMRAAFKSSRPRVTNALSVSTPGAAVKPRGKAEADQRFREKLLALQRGAAN